MAEFSIKDEQLAGVKGKVVVLTGKANRDLSEVRYSQLISAFRRFIGHRVRNCQLAPLTRSIGRQR